MGLPSAGFLGLVTGIGGLFALGGGRTTLGAWLFSASALFAIAFSRLALDSRQEAVMEFGHWVIEHLPEHPLAESGPYIETPTVESSALGGMFMPQAV